MRKYLILICMLTAAARPATGSVCGSKIGDLLCQFIQANPPTCKVMVLIQFPQPQFNWPSKLDVSPDSLKNFSLMAQDSLSRNLNAMKPHIDSLFSKYDLRSVTNSDIRMTAPNIPYDYSIPAIATVEAAAGIAGEPVVQFINYYSLGAPLATTTVPVSAIKATVFPFDTVLSGLARVLPNNRITPDLDTTIVVARYGLTFHFGRLPSSLVCCPQDAVEDFWLNRNTGMMGCTDIKYPVDSLVPYYACVLMTGGEFPPCTGPTCTSFINVNESYKTHEYRFQLISARLYMKVIDAYSTDSLKVRFDTLSFLSASKTSRAPAAAKSAPRMGLALYKDCIIVTGAQGMGNCRVAIYDAAGKKVFVSAVNGRNVKIRFLKPLTSGVYIIRALDGQGEIAMRKCFIK